MFTGGSMGVERVSPDLGIGLAILSGDGHDPSRVGQAPFSDKQLAQSPTTNPYYVL